MTDRFEIIKEGDEAELYHTITNNDLNLFVQLTGDINPLHIDETFASKTIFHKPVVHGMLTASFLSTIIGTKLPGIGSLWYEQNLRFLLPVYIGENIRIWVKVKHKSPAQRIITLETYIFNQIGRKIIEGEAKVKMINSEEKKPLEPNKKGAIIITGGAGGIGSAIARELADQGYNVVINYHTNEIAATALMKDINQKNKCAITIKADITSPEESNELIIKTLRTFDTLSGLIHNVSPKINNYSFIDTPWSEIQKHLDVQIKGAFNICQAAIPALLQSNGSIISIASITTDNIPLDKALAYNLAKAALVVFSRSLAVELGPKGVRVNIVSPGMTDTNLIVNIPEKTKMVTKMQTPLRRLATPTDIAGVVGFLLSDKARHITGETIRVCGGIVML